MYKLYDLITFPIKAILLFLIIFYKKAISPLLPNSCKFTPTCSTYGYLSIKRFGPVRGSFLTIKRILRCNIFSKGGHDPVKDNLKGEAGWIV